MKIITADDKINKTPGAVIGSVCKEMVENTDHTLHHVVEYRW